MVICAFNQSDVMPQTSDEFWNSVELFVNACNSGEFENQSSQSADNFVSDVSMESFYMFVFIDDFAAF